jgi:hypothetical protein
MKSPRKRKPPAFDHAAVLPEAKREIRFTVTKSPVTFSLGVVGELDDPTDPATFDGIIYAHRSKKKCWEGYQFRYTNTDNENPYMLSTQLGEQIKQVVLEAIAVKPRRKKRGTGT